ncbi:MAG TPA: hypothetical protein PK370_01110 [Candidatus Woesebacteria bacterium]|nr:hypothetical protein [Candidatus Woesebacteria bacterium]HPJ17480.1 hypothetical protein [Candidatus Woesebacteria bacterium]
MINFQLIKPVYAQVCNPLLNNCQKQVTDPKGWASGFIQGVISLFFVVGIIYFLWHFFMGAYHMIASNGDPKNFETSKHELMWAVLGLLIVFSIFVVLKIVGTVLGIQGLNRLLIPWPTL